MRFIYPSYQEISNKHAIVVSNRNQSNQYAQSRPFWRIDNLLRRDSNSIMNGISLNSFILFIILSLVHFNGDCTYANPLLPSNSFVVSSLKYPKTNLDPYQWRYIRVDVPPRFSSLSVELQSNANVDLSRISKIPKRQLPVICFRDGSLPLPDYSDHIANTVVIESLSNTSIGAIQGLQNKQHCYPMQKNIKVTLTNEQIVPGVWYIGFFNGIGVTRTQGKMINRGNTYSLSTNITVTGCTFPNFCGQHCNQTVEPLSCAQSFSNISLKYGSSAKLYKQTAGQVVSCNSSVKETCLKNAEQKLYFVEIGLAEQLIISAVDVKLNGNAVSLNKPSNSSGLLKAYARYGAKPSPNRHDYAVDLIKEPLIIRFPKAGNWYVLFVHGNTTMDKHTSQSKYGTVCYSFVSQVVECPDGKAGFNCSSNRYALQTIIQDSPFEPYYKPIGDNADPDSTTFLLEPLLSNSSVKTRSGIAWTYFSLNVPRAGGNIHIWVSSVNEMQYEIYARYGGLPSDKLWDYFYRSNTNNSDGSSFFMLNNSTEELADFYILFAREGTWNFAVKHPSISNVAIGDETRVSIGIERCTNDCSWPHGSCWHLADESGLTSYSYCSCDRDHGGYDCSKVIVTPKGHFWQSLFLIASNAAAILPAYQSLRHKAFAEWIIFTSSGISSGLYHACDVGTWCVMRFHVLQFMDFWLSFVAVISTFVYMAAIGESSRRTIHAAVFILTALLAAGGATRSSNVIFVLAIGAAGLIVGWLIELSTKYKSSSFAFRNFHMVFRRQAITASVRNVIRNIMQRFRWGYVIAGFITLGMAGMSWVIESSETYWIWHSLWHVTIYTASFFFLCSASCDNQRPSGPQREQQYELTRQDSAPRGQLEG